MRAVRHRSLNVDTCGANNSAFGTCTCCSGALGFFGWSIVAGGSCLAFLAAGLAGMDELAGLVGLDIDLLREGTVEGGRRNDGAETGVVVSAINW